MRWMLFAVCVLATTLPASAEPRLAGFAKLPPHTFREGPTSGQFIDLAEAPFNGVTPPFENKQPVQGISSMIAGNEPGTYLALSDNGFGAKANSADYILCVYHITPNFRTAENPGGGDVEWSLAFELSDPNNHVPWPIVADGETYPDSDIPVPAVIREKRLLTGADFDVESMVRLPDGTFWMGDEFGPFLLHFDAEGKLLEPPVDSPVSQLRSPDHPNADDTASVQRSGGYEGLWHYPVQGNPGILVPVLEKPLAPPPNLMFEQPTMATYILSEARFFMGLSYQLPAIAEAIGEVTRFTEPDESGQVQLLVLERDSEQHDNAKHKVVAIANFNMVSPRPDLRILRKPVADLLRLSDDADIDSNGDRNFVFPYVTIESVLAVDERTILVCNDNNYPFTNGRGTDDPDATEFILIGFDRPLSEFGTPKE